MILTNVAMIIIILIIGALFIKIQYERNKHERPDIVKSDKMTMDKLLSITKYALADIVREDNFYGLTDEEMDAMYKRKARLQTALREAVFGIDSAKEIVKTLIRTVIAKTLETVDDILEVIDFEDPNLAVEIKYEILMYFYQNDYGKDAMSKMIEEYNLADERYVIEDKAQTSYIITSEDIDEIYNQKEYILSYSNMLDIITILVYQRYIGFGKIDTLRALNIDGLNIGASGSIMSSLLATKVQNIVKATKSVWIYWHGKYIHCRFINMNTEEEIRRIVLQVCRWNSPGTLTEKRGYIVNTMPDKTRVLALRPPLAEYWAVFLRKFTISNPTPEYLFKKDYTNRADLIINLLRFLMAGQVTCAFTGRQGSGKTTGMTSIIRYIDPKLTIRVLEMAPEMYLRELYPDRNILSLQETLTVTTTEAQDALKKSDAAISIVGEVATDPIAANMIQMGMTASKFTIFSHHANTTKDLVFTLRNSLVNVMKFDSHTSERQVVQVVKINIHFDFDVSGKRYIEYVDEIIQLDEGIPYPAIDKNNIELSRAVIDREYYTRVTDRTCFNVRRILKYNKKTDTYETVAWFSPELLQIMLSNMTPNIKREFAVFYKNNWQNNEYMQEEIKKNHAYV